MPTVWVFLGLSLAITLGAQGYLKIQNSKCSKITSKKGMNGVEVARKILDKNGLKDVKIEEVHGILSDHYDPREKVVRLSDSVHSKDSIAAVSVAAHECGHAIQDKDGYFCLRFRSSIIPLVNIASAGGYIAIMLGILFGALGLFWIGIFCEVLILFFQLVTLPVEFNASRRGLKQLQELKIIDDEELSDSRGMLFAAALTYVAAVATSLLEIVRLVLMANRRD